jgi:hypothetical protein
MLGYIIYVLQETKIVDQYQEQNFGNDPRVLANEKPVRFGKVKFAKGT